jgi:hypothetical protein
MELLDLALIGWLFSVSSGIALALGVLIIVLHYRRGNARGQIGKWLPGDLLLFAIWSLGLAGGIGVLLDKAWSRPALELFCWTLMVLLLMSCWSRLRAEPAGRGMRAVSMALFVVPILAVCFATILTLRSETAVRVLSG